MDGGAWYTDNISIKKTPPVSSSTFHLGYSINVYKFSFRCGNKKKLTFKTIRENLNTELCGLKGNSFENAGLYV